nr:sigma-E factor negative regulatory protein [Lysobacter enzymogenes]
MTSTIHSGDDNETLSALFDGELDGDAARFAFKRLSHDGQWREACGRWQLCGDVLRRRAHGAAEPAGLRRDRLRRARRRGHRRRRGAAGQPGRRGPAGANRNQAAQGRRLAPRLDRGRGAGGFGRGRGAVRCAAVLRRGRRRRGRSGPGRGAGRAGRSGPARRSGRAATGSGPGAASAGRAGAGDRRNRADLGRRVRHRRRRGGGRGRAAAPPQRTPFARAEPTRRRARIRASDPGGAVAGRRRRRADDRRRRCRPRQPVPAAIGRNPAARPWPRAALPNYPSSSAYSASYGSSGLVSPSFYPFEPAQDASAARTRPPVQEPQPPQP